MAIASWRQLRSTGSCLVQSASETSPGPGALFSGMTAGWLFDEAACLVIGEEMG